MKTPLLALALLASCVASAAQADCYAEYKAKQDDPLRLQYGIALLPTPECPTKNTAAAQLEIRLDRNGWTLLSIVGLSEQEPSDKKKKNAGDFYLRY
ncbi:hypothetical protein [Alloyangia pacifica]|uniref:hypothetical protein n=1 Tax=Alloyangia pacifica TaxID=311180 RepID=UPI001CD23FCB|nr:hypothetical protein [Alloyangia pacifica]MCA0993889.1 hypothetical protein [Alloyangia pacifica]